MAGDMQAGVIDRFRSMPIACSSVLVGSVVASIVRNLMATPIVIAVALTTGFRPDATAGEWLAATGLLLLFIVAISWVTTAIGLLVRNVEAANGRRSSCFSCPT